MVRPESPAFMSGAIQKGVGSILSLALVLLKDLKIVAVNSKCQATGFVFKITLHRENWLENINV